MCGYISTDTKKYQKKFQNKIICYHLPVTYHMSHVSFYMNLSPAPTATATDHPHNNSPTMHCRLVHQDRTKKTVKNSKPQKIVKFI